MTEPPTSGPVAREDETRLVFNPAYESAFRARGLDDVRGFLRCPVDQVTGRSLEWTAGHLLVPGPDGVARRFTLRVYFPLRPSRGQASPPVREFDNLTRLRRLGLPVSIPVAAGQEITGRRLHGAFIVTHEPPDALSWQAVFEGDPATPLAWRLSRREGRRDAVGLLGRTIRRLHDAGFCHRDLYLDRVLWRIGEQGLECTITHCPNGAALPTPLPEIEVAADLATVLATARGAFSRTDCLSLVVAYQGGGKPDKALLRRVQGAYNSLLRAGARRMVRAGDLPGMPLSFTAPPGTWVSFREGVLYDLNLRKLADFDTLLHHEGDQRLTTHPARRAVRIPGDAQRDAIFLKALLAVHPKDRLRSVLSFGRAPTPAMREWLMLHAFAGHGIATPVPLGIAEHRPWGVPAASLLLLAPLPRRARRLDLFLDRRIRRNDPETWACIASVLAKVHRAGLQHGDLYAKHVFLECLEAVLPDVYLEAHLVDLQRAREYRRMTPARRARDLAALRATVPHAVLAPVAWRRVLRQYVAASPPGVTLRATDRAVEKARAKFARKERIVRMLFHWADRNPPLDPAPLEAHATGLEDNLPERHLIHPAYRDSLKWAGLESVLDFLYYEHADVLRERDGRANVRLTIDHNGDEAAFFLKRHQPLSVADGIREFLRTGAVMSPGVRECANAAVLRRIGIDTVPVVAAGEEDKPFHRRRSYFLSRQLEGAEPLDDFLTARFGGQSAPGPDDLRLKRRIIDLTARTARRFHAAGCHHQDFYLCHFFIRVSAGKGDSHLFSQAPQAEDDQDVALFLIDLQRMRQCRRLRRRWIVKDLAQLNYSAEVARIPRTDHMRFLLAYLNAGRLSRPHRRLLRAVLRKSARIARHDRKGA